MQYGPAFLVVALGVLASPSTAQSIHHGGSVAGPQADGRTRTPYPTTWYVDVNAAPPGTGRPGTPYASIQFALAQGTTVDGDTVIVLPGTYLEHLDFLGKDIHVVSAGGAAVTIVDGLGSGSVAKFLAGEGPDAVLDGFTLRAGAGTGVTPAIRGGGLLCVGASPTLKNLVVRDNKAKRGAGMYFESSSARVETSVIEDNAPPGPIVANNYGGGVYVACGSTVVFDHCTMQRNRPTSGAGILYAGGGVYGGGTYVACTMEDNAAYRGSGVDAGGCNPELLDCVIRDNHNINGDVETVTSVGGGVNGPAVLTGCTIESNSAYYGGGGAYRATLDSCTISDNSVQLVVVLGTWSSEGGGAALCTLVDCDVFGNVCNPVSAPESRGGGVANSVATRCRIYGNQARLGGGAVHSSLERCTLYGNQASTGGVGGGGGFVVQNGFTYNVHSSILYANTPNQIAVLSGTANVTYSDVQGSFAGTGNIAADPMFVNTSIGNFHLLGGSPCIDAGDPTTFDPDGSRADMGSHPYVPALAGSLAQGGGVAADSTRRVGLQPTFGEEDLDVTTPASRMIDSLRVFRHVLDRSLAWPASVALASATSRVQYR